MPAPSFPNLSELGITHCYASPYLQARAGSQHGYDITNHRALNPEIGSEAEYDVFVGALHAQGMGQILDTVPNHMGIVGNDNAWWNDVLENGPSSPYAGYFDIGWQDSPRPKLRNRVLLPILAEPYGQALEAQKIRLAYSVGAFTLHYVDHRFPVAPTAMRRSCRPTWKRCNAPWARTSRPCTSIRASCRPCSGGGAVGAASPG